MILYPELLLQPVSWVSTNISYRDFLSRIILKNIEDIFYVAEASKIRPHGRILADGTKIFSGFANQVRVGVPGSGIGLSERVLRVHIPVMSVEVFF